jgi:tRNA-uridine 2-sulfurtransferase
MIKSDPSSITVAVGMSGGVDSSVTALLLKQQGFKVIGLFMKNWEEVDENGVCRATYDYQDVQKVCEQIDIPYYAMNFSQEYSELVFNDFIESFKLGLTPNPDILCNREIKFKVFLKNAIDIGADFLATGHYCQNIQVGDQYTLVKGRDPNKDQTYFVYTLQQEILKRVLFPIGHLQKSMVRQIARENHLATAEKKDSTGICFIGKRDFRTFLSGYLAVQPGNFETLNGKIVGEHMGTAYYTLGQRKGLGIGGPGEAWFVVDKDMERNVVFVEQGTDHPALYRTRLSAIQLSWVSGFAPISFPYICSSKIRYRQEDQPCVIENIIDGKALITFPQAQRAITLGQSIVFYEGDVCLGGGIIHSF